MHDYHVLNSKIMLHVNLVDVQNNLFFFVVVGGVRFVRFVRWLMFVKKEKRKIEKKRKSPE